MSIENTFNIDLQCISKTIHTTTKCEINKQNRDSVDKIKMQRTHKMEKTRIRTKMTIILFSKRGAPFIIQGEFFLCVISCYNGSC